MGSLTVDCSYNSYNSYTDQVITDTEYKLEQ